MSTDDNSFEASAWNVQNSHQRQSATHTIWGRLIKPGYGGLLPFIMDLLHVSHFFFRYDARWKEAKAYEDALQNLRSAASKFDRTRQELQKRIDGEKAKRGRGRK